MLHHWMIFLESLWDKLRERFRKRQTDQQYASSEKRCHLFAYLAFVSLGPSFSSPARATWDLDPMFFEALSRWMLDSPKSKVDQVLQQIFDEVGNCTALLDIIPDSPFPVHTLVKALAGPVKVSMVCHLSDFIYSLVHNYVVYADHIQSKSRGPCVCSGNYTLG
jgi:hypothetical protein